MALIIAACNAGEVQSPDEAPGADLGTADLTSGCAVDPMLCGECLSDKQCPLPERPRCDLDHHTCTACRPGPTDNCPAGQVCSAKLNGGSCVSGCSSDEDCQRIGGGVSCCGGACVNPSVDAANCGACGRACPAVPNGTTSCSLGICVIDSMRDCRAGHADCDHDLTDGCEVDLTTDIANCGACGVVAPNVPNAVPHCENAIAGFHCVGAFLDCDGDPDNGCEVDASHDANDCGLCGNACARSPNAAPSCVNAACGLRCNPGFGDCDGVAGNGCEALLVSDVNNCGACGVVCGSPKARVECDAGQCRLLCDAGFQDCDGDPRDGCEVNTSTDRNNCGGCGAVCPKNTAGCVLGKCVAGCLDKGANFAATRCSVGKDPETGDPWTVCLGSCQSAWLSSLDNNGRLHPLQICQSLGYGALGSYGTTCGQRCGDCDQNNKWSCNNLGPETFDGNGGCGKDQFGLILCGGAQWQCLP